MDILEQHEKYPPRKRMSLEECRKVAPELKDLSDEELLETRDLLYEFEEIIYEVWSSLSPEERRERIRENELARKKEEIKRAGSKRRRKSS